MAFENFLDKFVPTIEAGGPLVTSMRGINRLSDEALKTKMQELQNQYYAPNIQSEIAQRQAQTNKLNTMTPLEAAELQLKNKYYGPNIESEISHRSAQNALLGQQTLGEKYKLSHPELMYSGDAQFLEYLKNNYPNQANKLREGTVSQPGVQQEEVQNSLSSDINRGQIPKTGNALIDATLTKKFAPALYQQRMTQAFEWAHTPVEAKSYQIAQLAGAGLDPSQAVHELTSGKTVPQILQEHGFDPSNPPEPDFLPTKGNITQLKQRQAALSEIQSLNKKITNGLAPYIKTIKGYSPAQIADALKGENKERQAEFLAARSLAPELANLRLKLAGGQAGITAQTEMSDKAFTNINAFQALVDKDVFIKSQELVDEWLSDAFEKANKRMTQVGKNNKNKKNELKNPKEMTTEELLAEFKGI